MKLQVRNGNDDGDGSLRQALSNTDVTVIKIKSNVRKICLQSEIIVSSTVKIYTTQTVTITVKEGRHFNINGGYLFQLKNLILRDGKEGSIYVNTPDEHTLILKDTVLKYNKALYGGAILTNNNLIVIRSSIIKNCASFQGGGCWVGKNVTLVNSKIDNNKIISNIDTNSTFGGGLNIDNGNLTMNNSSISFNNIYNNITTCNDENSSGFAGGVNVMSGNITLYKSKIDSNTAFSSGGIKMGTGNINILSKSSVSKNKSFISGDNCGGGGITIINGNVIIDKSKICKNVTRGMYSGSIVSFLGNVSINKSIISKNVNRGPGGGIAANFNCCMTITKSKIIGNSGSSLGAAIVNFSNNAGQIYVSDSIINSNTLTNYQTLGQTIAAFLNVIINLTNQELPSPPNIETPGIISLVSIYPIILNFAQMTNGELQNLVLPLEISNLTAGTITTLLKCPVTITHTQMKDNFITKKEIDSVFEGYGGAIFNANSDVVVNSSDLSYNRVTTGATAIFNNSNLITNNCNIKSNKVENDNFNMNKNGTIFNSGNSNLIDTNISHNHVTNKGAGIYNMNNLVLIQDKITHNKVGGIYSTTNFINCDTIILDNIPNNIVIQN